MTQSEMLRDKDKWREIRESEKYAPLRDMLAEDYEQYCHGKGISQILFSDEMDFFRTGSRARFEKLYFSRRCQLSIYAIYAMMYPEKAEYLEKLQDVICEICNEYSWQLPAHRPVFYRNKRDGLALFSCETGLYLAEIKYMLSDRLDVFVTERITKALDERILKSFENEAQWFESLKSNWAAVCGGSLGMTFMYESPERFSKVQPRIEKCMENYRDGILSDGSTSEGASYWNYGMCFYAMYYDNLRRYTMGRGRNGLKDEKMKRFAGFYSDLMLGSSVMTSFSDASSSSGCDIWLIYFLSKEYGIELPPCEMCYINTDKLSAAVRAFMYFDPELSCGNTSESERFFDKLGWYIKRTESYGFAVKGGNNGEEHNHNDIGSFIVAGDGKQILCDLGAAEYTAFNFGKDRYKVFNNSSLGHSVPIVNGCEQGTGSEFYGCLEVSDAISVDMSAAYPGSVGKLIRQFRLDEGSISLKDSFDKKTDIRERFITEIEPSVENGRIIIDGTELIYDTAWRPSVTVKSVPKHGGDANRTVYVIDFESVSDTDRFEMEIRL